MRCRTERFTVGEEKGKTVVTALEDLEKENARLRQRLLMIEEMLDKERKENEITKSGKRELIRIGVEQEREWKEERNNWNEWRWEGSVKLMELEELIREEVSKMIEEKRKGEWEVGLTRGLALAYEICMKEKDDVGLCLTKMVMRGVLKENDELWHKGKTGGELVVGGMDIEDLEVGVRSGSDIYDSLGAWIVAKGGKKVLRSQNERLAKEIVVVRAGEQLGSLLFLWEREKLKEEQSTTGGIFGAARECLDGDKNPAVAAVAAKAEALRRQGNVAAQQMRIITGSMLTGVCDTATILEAATVLVSRWAQVADVLRQFTTLYQRHAHPPHATSGMDVIE